MGALPLDWPIALYAVACIFAAAVVRGFAGFGFSLLAISSLSLVMAPAEIIPPVFMMEIAASIGLLPSIWREVHWRALALLWLGCLAGTPLGVHALATVPVAPIKVALALAVLGAVALLWSGYARRTMPGTAETFATGTVAGVLNGAFGIVAPPVIVFFFNSPAGASISRASLIAFFIGTDAIGLAYLARAGLVTVEGLQAFALLLVPLAAGQWLGTRGFRSIDPARFRAIVLAILVVLALLIGAQGIAGLLARA